MLVLWSDDLDGIIPLCRDFEERLIKLVWRARGTISVPPSEVSSSGTPSDDNLAEKSKEASPPGPVEAQASRGAKTRSTSLWKLFSWRSTRPEPEKDMELAASKSRRTKLLAPLYNGLGCALTCCKYVLGLALLH